MSRIITRFMPLLSGLLLLSVLLALLIGTATDSHELAYVSLSHMSQHHIRLLDAGRGYSIPLMSGDHFASISSRPQWTPDGSGLIFSANDGTGSQIYQLNLENGQLLQLTHLETNTQYEIIEFALSPDGKQIAFLLSEGFDNQVYLMNRDGSEVRQVTGNPGFIQSSLNWSYDSMWLTYTASTQTSSVLELWLLDARKGYQPERLLKNQSGMGAILGRWSPVSQQITFIGIPSDPNLPRPYLLLEVASGQIRQLFDDGFAVQTANWSPDGKMLAYANRIDTGTTPPFDRILLLDLATGQSPPIADLPERYHVFDITWSSDGALLALSLNEANTRSDILAVRLSDGALLNLGSHYIPEARQYDEIRLFPAWRP